jgi:hypothetical protein
LFSGKQSKAKRVSSKKEEESSEDESEEDEDEAEDETEAETTQETSTADEGDHNDSDVGSKTEGTRRGLKFSGFRIKKSEKFETDEEMTEGSVTDEAKGRNVRKRKLTEEMNVSKTTEKFAKHKQIEVLTSSGRSSRGGRPVSAEVVSDETDEESSRKRSKRNDKTG